MAQLLYVTDPMCSWCWGFRAVLDEVVPELAEGVSVRLVMGGLAEDDERPMDAKTRSYVQRAWRAVEARTGARFEHGFWDRNQPRRSTWPACRAVLAAGERGPEMFAAIQRAYYLEARDPSDREVLLDLAQGLGLDRASFDATLDSPETRERLAADFLLRERLAASGFPSVGVGDADGERPLIRGWVDAPTLRSALAREGLLRGT